MSPLQFFIISVITIMVQSAPVKRVIIEADRTLLKEVANRTDIENKPIILFCATQLLERRITLLQNISLSTLLKSDINNNTKEVINETFNHFSSICQDFTLAMSLQHQLQDYLLNQSNQDLNDEDTDELSDQIKKFSLLLVALQTMSNILDQLQFYKNSSNCPRLSSSEYKMMYQVQYSTTHNNNITSLLEPIRRNWISGDKYKPEFSKPDPRNCKALNLFTAR